ncbi:MAG: DUF1566 domain-containing protein [Moraxellaceae bacterium]|nr:DUF1566 domain-containing protein [Moraxellaceae bacterium]
MAKIGTNGEKLAANATQWAAVIDEETQLMWAINPNTNVSFPNRRDKETYDKTLDWINIVNNKGWCSYNDWRLPTREELQTLLLPEIHTHRYIREDIFTDITTHDYWVWSSSSVSYDSSCVHIVGFSNNGFGHINRYTAHYMRLVRKAG